nr:ribonuclease H-like domain-containing protein [Tanacetum cinerariifolium]
MNCDFLETQYYYSPQHSGQGEEQGDLLSWLSYTSTATIGNEIQNHSTTSTEAPNISATPEHPVPDMISEESSSQTNFAQILRIPCEGACVFSDRWSLDELVYGAPSEGSYQTDLPSPDDIISFIREDREGQVTRIRHQEEVEVQHYQIFTREIVSTLKPLEEIIQENVLCLGVIGTTFPHVFVICFIVLQTSKNSILPISWQNEWSGLPSELS